VPGDRGAAPVGPPGPEIIAVAGPLPAARLAQVEAIFFEASGRRFEPGPARDAFRQRWLGRYLDAPGDPVLLAVAGATVAGYLIGSLEDPAEQPRFADLEYYATHFAAHCRRFPAHLHINLAPAYRGHGLGQALIAAFAAQAMAAGVAGVHVVTGKGMRNVRFYERCGFEFVASAPWNGREVVLLGKELAAGRPTQAKDDS
jgi:GNAT superfamily N-acetyltransferase